MARMSRAVHNNPPASSYNDYLGEPISQSSPHSSPTQNTLDSASDDSHFHSSSTTAHTNRAPSLRDQNPANGRQSFETSGTEGVWNDGGESSYGGSQRGGPTKGHSPYEKNPFADNPDQGIKHRPAAGQQRGPGFASWNGSASSLLPPNAPFTGTASPRPLSVNYLPTKFAAPHKQGQWAHRRAKVGGGRAAFGRHESRMPDEGPDDGSGKQKRPKLLWNRFKWLLFIANTVLIAFSLIGLVCVLLVWFNVWHHADVIRVGDRTPLIISTIACCLCLVTSLIGYAGILLNNRAFLAVYSLLLWFCFALIITPGYITYKQWAFNLEGKINRQWSRELGEMGRLRIQNQLNCCGYYSPFVEATISATCYSRASLTGCKGKYLRFRRNVLHKWFITSFALAPVQLAIMIIALICSNQVTYRFGKGLTPKQYRLDLGSLAFIMDGYAGEIAAAYGPGLAAEAITRSSSNLELLQASNHGGSSRPQSAYNSPKGSPYGTPHNQSRASMLGPDGGEYAMSGLGSNQQGQQWDESDGEENTSANGGSKKKKWMIGGGGRK